AGVAGTAVSAAGSGNVLLKTLGKDADVIVGAGIVSGTGHVTVLGSRSVSFTGTGGLRTGGAGTVDLEAGSGSITMVDQTAVATASGAIRLLAAQNVTLGKLSTAGNVGVTATAGSILDAGDSAVDVRAQGLSLVAGQRIGQGRPLATTVATLAAQAGSGGIDVVETDGVTVSTVAVGYQQVQADGGVLARSLGALAGLKTSANGGVKLTALAGDIRLEPGTGGADAVSTKGSGGITLVAQQGTININATLRSEQGALTLQSRRSVEWGAQGQVLNGTQAAGSTLTLRPVDPAQAIVIGRSAPTQPVPDDNTWYVDNAALTRMRAGYDRIVIGGAEHTGSVTVDGRSSTVSFLNAVEIRAAAGATVTLQGSIQGKSLLVNGAAPVVLSDVQIGMSEAQGIVLGGQARLSGQVVLSASSVAFRGGNGSVQAAKPGTTLTLRPTSDQTAVLVGTGSGALVDAASLQALASGFAGVEIGYASRQADLRVEGLLSIADALTLQGRKVVMSATSVLTSTADVKLSSTDGVSVGRILAANHTVTVLADKSTARILSATAANTVNVTAQTVVVSGFGPVQGEAGNPLRVNSSQVSVLAPSGVVLRQTQSDGTVQVVVLDDGTVHVQLINVNTSVIVSGQSAARAAPMAAKSAAVLAAPGWGIASRLSSPTSTDVTWQAAPAGTAALGSELGQAFLLGGVATQPVSAGVLSTGAGRFDYWVEDISF
ncbi:hypothetical protein, partial [Azohydromonas lata]|uniref:hypothetical protein n=1 Tax=Azohydromonas lata TaxID=45677 RepID=UPI0014715063